METQAVAVPGVGEVLADAEAVRSKLHEAFGNEHAGLQYLWIFVRTGFAACAVQGFSSDYLVRPHASVPCDQQHFIPMLIGPMSIPPVGLGQASVAASGSRNLNVKESVACCKINIQRIDSPCHPKAVKLLQTACDRVMWTADLACLRC